MKWFNSIFIVFIYKFIKLYQLGNQTVAHYKLSSFFIRLSWVFLTIDGAGVALDIFNFKFVPPTNNWFRSTFFYQFWQWHIKMSLYKQFWAVMTVCICHSINLYKIIGWCDVSELIFDKWFIWELLEKSKVFHMYLWKATLDIH